MGLMDFKPASEEEVRRKEEELGIEEEILSPLASRILSDFQLAKNAKVAVHTRLISCLRQFMSKYSPQHKAEIEEAGFLPLFIPITNIKCRAGKAWLNDIYFEPGKDVFDVKPSPVPDLPKGVEAKIEERLQTEVSSILEKASLLAETSGGNLDMSSIFERIGEHGEELKAEYEKRVQEKAKKLCDRVRTKLKDQFVEGGFYKAFREVLQDITVYPTAIMKGPVPRKAKRFTGPDEVDEVTIPTFNRVSPFDAYPSPNSPDFNSGFFIEVLHLSEKSLHGLAGEEGFDGGAITEFLKIHPDGYRVMVEGERYEQVLGYQTYYEDRIFDVIEYWGTLPGWLLKEWGQEGIDETDFYDVCAWVLDRTIIGVMLNPDPLGKKPYSKASFIDIPDSFWGISLPEVLESLQTAINSMSRAIVANSVFSSGPMVETNEDRIGHVTTLSPYMVFHAKESALNAAPAVRFYQPRETAMAVAQVMFAFQKMADEYSGIPAYAHGDVTVGGAGRTAAGLSMLQSHATKGIKDVVMNIDDGIIRPITESLYYTNIAEGIFSREEIPDLSIEATGVTNYSAKEAQASRLLEFLRLTSNPTDIQITGPEGRKFLLEGVAKRLGIDVEKLFPSEIEEVKQMLESMVQQGGQMSKPNQQEGIVAQAQDARKGVMGGGA